MAYQSLIEEDITLVQGDSSDISTIYAKDYPILDNDWNAKFTITSSDGTIVLQRDLPKNTATTNEPANSYFIFQILPNESETLNIGKYILAIQVENLSLGHRREIVQTKLNIIKQYV